MSLKSSAGWLGATERERYWGLSQQGWIVSGALRVEISTISELQWMGWCSWEFKAVGLDSKNGIQRALGETAMENREVRES